ncbi:MAG: VWA domain-containing protein [Candidatus Acidiferrales bacterium]|jgi:Ca-activated chloride channel family protein
MRLLLRTSFVLLLVSAAVFVGKAQQQQPSQAPPTPSAAAPPQQGDAKPAPQQPTEAPKQAPPLKVTTGLVHLVAAVSDRRNNFITDLEQKDFRIIEDGKVQDIKFFGRQTDLPLRIGMLLDTSNSIRERLHFEKDASIDFLDSVIRRHKDQAFLMTFDNEPEVIQDFTGDVGTLTQAIEKQRAGGGTSLNDAIYVAAQKLVNAPMPDGANPEVRRVLVVFSDGEDNLSDRALSESIEMAERCEVSIYSISTSTDWVAVTTVDRPHKMFKTPGDEILEKFAVQTGGRVFFPYKVDDLAESFQDIGAELRSQYFIAYAPSVPPDGKYRKIEVDIADRKGLTVRTRKGYYATENPGALGPPAK